MRAVIQRVLSANVSVDKVLNLKANPEDGAGTTPELTDKSVDKNPTALIPHDDSNQEIVAVSSTQIVQEIIGEIGRGIVVFLGVGREDTDADVSYLVDRAINLRIFPDPEQKMNLSLLDVEGQALIISQFTLYGDARKGRRPSFFEAMDPTEANGYYMSFCKQMEHSGVKVAKGRFGADMRVSLINDGPVTIMLDSKKNF